MGFAKGIGFGKGTASAVPLSPQKTRALAPEGRDTRPPRKDELLKQFCNNRAQ
jgi:hypothetical protein